MKTGLNQTKRQVEVKTAKTILGIVLLFCLSWMPYAIVSLIGVFGGQDYITPATSVIPGILAKCSTIYNPIMLSEYHQQQAISDAFAKRHMEFGVKIDTISGCGMRHYHRK